MVDLSHSAERLAQAGALVGFAEEHDEPAVIDKRRVRPTEAVMHIRDVAEHLRHLRQRADPAIRFCGTQIVEDR